MPLTTATGTTDDPAHLAGYGPIPATLARDLAADAPWRLALTDPTTGEVTARSARTYRPPALLAATVADRDTTCTFPGCRVPAERCDIDHLTAYDHRRAADDQTTSANLHLLCRHHHRMKTHGHWTPHRDPTTGTTTWTSPTGHTYTRDPVIPHPPPTRPAELQTDGRQVRRRPEPGIPEDTSRRVGTGAAAVPDDPLQAGDPPPF